MTKRLANIQQSSRPSWLSLLLLTLAISSCSSHGSRVPAADQEAQFYSETHDEDGRLRPQYEGVWQHYQSLSEKEKSDFIANSKLDFKNDNALAPLPRLLTEEESLVLKTGVEQRSKALVAFLKDHYSGKKSYLNDVIPKEVIDRIIRRSGEEGFEGLVDPDRIAFPYGPDIIRDKQGVWRVLEDNPGFIGGIGDLRVARETFLKRIPEYKNLLDLKDKPDDYYKEIGKRYKASPGKGRAVVYMIPPYADNEDLRLKKLYAEQGLQIVTPYSAAKLVTTDKGLYVEEKKGATISRYRVGYLVLNGEHAWVDTDHPATRMRGMYEDINYWLFTEKPQKLSVRKKLKVLLEEFEKTGTIDEEKYFATFKDGNITPYMRYQDRYAQRLKGFVDLWSKGAFEMNYTPGVDFIGDKEFTQYVEKLVRFYLGEEPILKNVPTYDFAIMRGGRLVLDQKLFNKVAADKANYVIKQVDGRGGEGIWVGSKLSETEWKKGLAAVKAHPQKFQVQEYKHLSVMGDLIVDLRMISVVDAKGTYVSPTPWGRGLPLKGNGKVNLSDEGLEVAIAVVKSRQSCSKHLVDLHQ